MLNVCLLNKFIFIEYDANIHEYEIGESVCTFGNDKMLTMTRITLSDYSILYRAMENKKMKLPVRLLRLLKEELYLFTITNEPTKNLKVAMIDDNRISNDELVISVGTTEKTHLNGLKGVSADQWYRNIVMHDLEYENRDLLSYAPELAKQVSGKLPINSLYQEEFQSIPGIKKLLVYDFEDIISNTIRKQRARYQKQNLKSIIDEKLEFDKELLNIAFLNEKHLPLQDIENYLKEKFKENNNILMDSSPSVRTNLRRLIRIYDYLKGKIKSP